MWNVNCLLVIHPHWLPNWLPSTHIILQWHIFSEYAVIESLHCTKLELHGRVGVSLVRDHPNWLLLTLHAVVSWSAVKVNIAKFTSASVAIACFLTKGESQQIGSLGLCFVYLSIIWYWNTWWHQLPIDWTRKLQMPGQLGLKRMQLVSES